MKLDAALLVANKSRFWNTEEEHMSALQRNANTTVTLNIRRSVIAYTVETLDCQGTAYVRAAYVS